MLYSAAVGKDCAQEVNHMFFKSSQDKDQQQPEKKRPDIAYDNLAIPEIHTGEVQPEPEKPREESEGYTVDYDNLAVPEINPPHKHKK